MPPKVCCFFLRGKCPHGGKCKYAHADLEGVPCGIADCKHHPGRLDEKRGRPAAAPEPPPAAAAEPSAGDVGRRSVDEAQLGSLGQLDLLRRALGESARGAAELPSVGDASSKSPAATPGRSESEDAVAREGPSGGSPLRPPGSPATEPAAGLTDPWHSAAGDPWQAAALRARGGEEAFPPEDWAAGREGPHVPTPVAKAGPGAPSSAAAQEHTSDTNEDVIAAELADFVRGQGGTVDAGLLGEFYQRNHVHKITALYISDFLQEFCGIYSHLLTYHPYKKCVSLAEPAAQASSSSAPAAAPARAAAKTAPDGAASWEDSEELVARMDAVRLFLHAIPSSSSVASGLSSPEDCVANLLVNFATLCGGSIGPSEMEEFYAMKWGKKAQTNHIDNLGGLKELCARRSDLLVYHPPAADGSQPVLVSLATPAARATSSSAPQTRLFFADERQGRPAAAPEPPLAAAEPSAGAVGGTCVEQVPLDSLKRAFEDASSRSLAAALGRSTSEDATAVAREMPSGGRPPPVLASQAEPTGRAEARRDAWSDSSDAGAEQDIHMCINIYIYI